MTDSIIHTESSGLTVLDGSTKDTPAHSYYAWDKPLNAKSANVLGIVEFQNGPVPTAGVNGWTNEALLAVLIHRTKALNDVHPCDENGAAIYHMENALDFFNRRTARRKARGVEGKDVT